MTDNDIDPALVDAFCRGEDEGVRAVYERFAGPVFVAVLRVLGDRDLAADAMQETFIRAWRAAGRYDANRALGPWLFTIARRVAIDTWRARRRISTQPVEDDLVVTPPPELDSVWEAYQVRAAVDRVRGLLDSSSTWADPPEMLEGVLTAIRSDRDGAQPAPRLPRRRLFTLAAGFVAFGAGSAAAGWVAADLPGRERGTQIELAGTELAPYATAEGTVRETAGGVAITLRFRDLAPAAPGTYYAAWLSAPDLEPVPVGSFHLRGGDQQVELWAGVDTAAYQTVMVTLEPTQDGSGSSGQVVLSGAVPAPQG